MSDISNAPAPSNVETTAGTPPETETRSPAPSNPIPSEAAKGPASTLPEAVKEPRRRKIIVDGQEEELDLDEYLDSLRNDESRLIRDYQKSKAADKRMAESATVRKQFADFVRFARENPFEALKDPVFGGVDLEKLAEERIAAKYREATMDPAEREKLEMRRQIETFQKAEAERKRADDERYQSELEERVTRDTEAAFVDALTTEGLPATPETLAIMAEVARVNFQKGIGLTKEQLAAEVRGRMNAMNRSVFSRLKGEALLKHLGADTVKEVLRLSVEKARKSRSPSFSPPPGAQQSLDFDERPKRQMKSATAFRKFTRE